MIHRLRGHWRFAAHVYIHCDVDGLLRILILFLGLVLMLRIHLIWHFHLRHSARVDWSHCAIQRPWHRASNHFRVPILDNIILNPRLQWICDMRKRTSFSDYKTLCLLLHFLLLKHLSFSEQLCFDYWVVRPVSLSDSVFHFRLDFARFAVSLLT